MKKHLRHNRKTRKIIRVILAGCIVGFVILTSIDIKSLEISIPPSVNRAYKTKPWFGICDAEAVFDITSFRSQIAKYPELALEYAQFDWQSAHVVTVLKEERFYVTYRSKFNGIFPWSNTQIIIKPGELLITDRLNIYDETRGYLIRAWCCNMLGKLPGRITRSVIDEPPSLLLTPEGYGVSPPTIGSVTQSIQQGEFITVSKVLPTNTNIIPPIVFLGDRIVPPKKTIVEGERCKPTPKEEISSCNPTVNDMFFCNEEGKMMFVPPCSEGENPIPEAIPTPETSTLVLFIFGIIGIFIASRIFKSYQTRQ